MKQCKRVYSLTATLCVFTLALAAVFTLSAMSLFKVTAPVESKAVTRVVRVTTAQELFTALKTATAGDEIVLAEGTYEGKLGTSASGHGSSFFNSDMSGTAAQPIILRSENPNQKSTLIGTRISTGNVLRITGDYWLIKDIQVTGAQKGIMLDNANYCQILNCDVYGVGMEGIHFRDNSSYNVADGCTVTDTGLQTPSYGEGIYVGTAKGSWETYAENCHYNEIRNCNIGPGVTAEHVDIKEGTNGTVVVNCIFDGVGMTGANYADSFIDVKGNDAVISGNIGYRNQNAIILDAFQVHSQLPGWGLNNIFSNNTVYLDNTAAHVVNVAGEASAIVSDNVRVPQGNMYNGNVTNENGSTNPEPNPDPEPDPDPEPNPDPEPDPDPDPEPNPDPNLDPDTDLNADTYDNTRAYLAGDVVVYQGQTFMAKWWTQGVAPNANDPWGPWEQY